MKNLKEIKGIGVNTVRDFNNLGIYDTKELLEFYPFRYEVLEKSNINNINDGDKVIFDGICENVPSVYYISRKLNKMSFRLNIGTKVINVVIFNRAFLKNNLSVGKEITVIGKYDMKHNVITASDIKFGLLNETVIEPIYHCSYKLNSKKINKVINSIISKETVLDYIPDGLNEKYHFMDKSRAVYLVHNPSEMKVVNEAVKKLKYEELFLFMLKMNYLKKNRKWEVGISRKIAKEDLKKFIDTLPFSLTEDQINCINTILEEMNSNHVMKRLIQGDVGSGKTIVAVVALYMNYISGYQGAFMAPTEILAVQHYENLIKLYKDTPIKIELLTGKMKPKERQTVLRKLANKETDIVIGTHSLFSEDVIYDSLGLVITDEQHRFGVAQRTKLKEKGHQADILYLSATPIPRTYAITLYGDMDVSSIHTKPKGRKEVITELCEEKDIKIVLDKIHREIKEGHQVYIIATQIEES